MPWSTVNAFPLSGLPHGPPSPCSLRLCIAFFLSWMGQGAGWEAGVGCLGPGITPRATQGAERGGEGALKGCPGPQEMPLIFYVSVILSKCQTAEQSPSPSSQEGDKGRAPPGAPLPPSGPSKTTQRAAAWPGIQTPRGERRGLDLTLFISFTESSQRWADSCHPPDSHHVEH